MEDIMVLVYLILGILISGFIALLISRIPVVAKWIRSFRGTGIAEVDQVLKAAVDFATKFVENLDQKALLDQLLVELKGKGRVKLDMATDLAVEYLENVLDQAGIKLNIDEELIKKAIQKYVWDNPELFPSKGDSTGESENFVG